MMELGTFEIGFLKSATAKIFPRSMTTKNLIFTYLALHVLLKKNKYNAMVET